MSRVVQGNAVTQMLKPNQHRSLDEADPGIWGASRPEPWSVFIGIIRRQLPIFLGLTALILSLGLTYLYTAVPTYTATASLLIDTRKAQVLEKQTDFSNVVVDTGMVQSQIEILKSQNIGRAVIGHLRLTEDPEFAGDENPGFVKLLLNQIFSIFGRATSPPTEALRQRLVLAGFESKLTVTRLGQSYVIEVGFQSTDPEKAARIANAVAAAYFDDQLEAKYTAIRRASAWLLDRLKELRTQASTQQQAVVTFREKNHIVDAGDKLLNAQQVSEVGSQLILAQASTAEAKARYERIREIMTHDASDASIADALKSEVIIKLRNQYLEMAGREALWSQKYGADHLSVVGLRAQMNELLRSIKDEMQKIEESYKSDFEIAQAREISLTTSLANAISQSQVTSQAQVQLQELESSAQTSKALHDNFLQRYMEAIQQQSFPITEARLISSADIPLSKSSPKTMLVLLLTAAAGLVVGFGGAYARELSDQVFRSSDQVEDVLQINCLGILPWLRPLEGTKRDAKLPLLLASPTLRKQCRSQWLFDYVLDHPYSKFSESLRFIKTESDLNLGSKSNKVIGITSTVPHEGKSTISANFAQITAHSGRKTILVDADLRNPQLSREKADEGSGLVDILAESKTVDEVLLIDSRSGLNFLPAGPKSNSPHTNELLASAAMLQLIETLRQTYDYVIIDLPPLIPIVDARATTGFIDSYIYVVDWGRTKVHTAKYALAKAPEIYTRLLGVVMNKVDMSTVKRYERHSGGYYLHDEYSAHYESAEPPITALIKNQKKDSKAK